MRVFVHCDNSFRKQKFINEKLIFLDTDDEEEDPKKLNVINFLYGYTYKKINREVNQLNARLQRHRPDNTATCLNYVDCVILFHNFVEYNNGMDSIIATCMEFNIPIVIYSDHVKKGFITSSNGELIVTNQFPTIDKLNTGVVMKHFNYEEYKFKSEMDFQNILKLIRQNYEELKDEKVDRSIKDYNLSL